MKLIIILLIILLLFLILVKPKEGYGAVNGAAAPYQEQLVNCLNQCEKEDPDKRLLTQSNLNCAAYCDFIISDMAEKGVPPEDFPLVNFSLDSCEKRCSKGTYSERRQCLGLCYSDHEIAQWCKEMQCPYSTFPEDECMSMCVSSKRLDTNNMRWNWSKA